MNVLFRIATSVRFTYFIPHSFVFCAIRTSSTVIKISFVDLSIKQRRYTMERNLIDTVVMAKKLSAPLSLHRKVIKTTPDAMVIKEKEICTDKTDIADAFNDYFATICSNNHVQPNDTPSYENYLNTPTDTSFIGYEPAGLTVHPPPRIIEGGFIFFAWVSSVTKIFS